MVLCKHTVLVQDRDSFHFVHVLAIRIHSRMHVNTGQGIRRGSCRELRFKGVGAAYQAVREVRFCVHVWSSFILRVHVLYIVGVFSVFFQGVGAAYQAVREVTRDIRKCVCRVHVCMCMCICACVHVHVHVHGC